MVLRCNLLLLLFDLPVHRGHLRRYLLRGLLDNFIYADFCSDLLRLGPKVQSLQGLLGILRKLRYAAYDRSLRLANQGVLQNSGQLRVPEVDVVVAAGVLAHRKLVNDV